MSRFNGTASSQQLWNAPISQTLQSPSARAQQQAQAQADNEAAWRRSQGLGPDYDEPQYAQPGPVDYDIYNKAVAVSSPRLGNVEGDIDPQATIRKTVMRRVEVPFTRNVQVPTQVVKLVPTQVEMRVPVRKLVEQNGFQTVNETYIEYEERQAVREKEIWVKRVVPEQYIERVPVQKVRQVQKPTTVIREVESWETVLAPSTRRVVTDGFRVESVADSRVVEVEEEQVFALRPEPTGPNEIKSTRDLGRLQNPHSHLPDAPPGSQSTGPISPSYNPLSPYNRPQSQQSPQQSQRPPFGAPTNPLEALRGHGLGVDETHTRHTDGSGVVVTRIDRGGNAARAGLQVSDIITAVQGRPTTTVAEFLTLLGRAPGAVTLSVNRDGRRNLALVFSS